MREQTQSLTGSTRREFLKGRGAGTAGHIASVLVQAWPEKIPGIKAHLARFPGIESHGSNGAGKLILTIEAEDDAGLMDAIRRIESTPGVIVASLVYHQFEETGHER